MKCKCDDCGAEFEQPDGKMEPHGEMLFWCPECGSGNWDFVKPGDDDE